MTLFNLPFNILTKRKISLLFFILSMVNGYGQLTINSNFGLMFPGKQDLKYRYYENGILTRNIITSKVTSSVSALPEISVSYWLKKIGFNISYQDWEHKARGIRFKTPQKPPFILIEESRSAVLLSIFVKSKSPQVFDKLKIKSFGYWGLGAGAAITEVTPGLLADKKICLQALYGLNFKLNTRFAFFTEARYILTHDADNYPPSSVTDWLVDTSGHPAPIRFGPHLDTRYYKITFGVNFLLF